MGYSLLHKRPHFINFVCMLTNDDNNHKATTLYVSDLDGTLLNSDTLLSDTTVKLLNKAIAHGAMFTVATARTPATVTTLMSRVAVKLPMIVLAGAAMWHDAERTYSDVQTIGGDTVNEIADVFERHGLHPLIYRRHGGMLHVRHCGQLSPQEQQFVAERTGLELKRFYLDDSEQQYRDEADGEAVLLFSMQKLDRLEPVYNEIKSNPKCSVMFYPDIFDPTSGFIEIYRAGCTKAQAISRLARQLGAERTVVFGDNGNDLAMMRAATHSVAVANAIPAIKEAASEITGTNNADSVARWICADMGLDTD